MNENNIVEIRNLSVNYETDDGTLYAVNDINLDIRRGEVLGLVGETGAGKSTTARSIIQLLPDRVGHMTSGTITFEGETLAKAENKSRIGTFDIAAKREKEKNEARMRAYRGERISMIFQDPMSSLNPVLTISDQLAEVFLMHSEERLSKAEIDRKVDEALRLVNISAERKYEYPHQFSGGMKQRVCIAMALACKPELLLADEPTTALDVTIQAQVLQLMKNLQKELGTSVLLITHDLGVVAEMCNRVAVMYAGEIIELGDADDVFDENQPHHPYTVGLFGSVPDLNMSSRRLKPIDGLMPDPAIKLPGCPFADRCPKATDRCRNERPAAYKAGKLQLKCFLFENEGGEQ